MPTSPFDDIRALLREGELELALEQLEPLVKEYAPRHRDEYIIQAGRLASLQKRRRMNLLTDQDAAVERNRLSADVLAFLDAIERELVRARPVDRSVAAAPFTVPVSGGDPREKILGAMSHLKSLAWLRRGLDASRAVCRILAPDGSRGSGFHVGGGRVLTNHHVLPSRELAEGATIEFNYEEDLDGRVLSVARYRVEAGGWRASEPFDCALVMLTQDGSLPAAETWGALSLCTTAPKPGDHVTIVQHPSGGLKQIALTANQVVNVFDHRLQYTTDTLPGSSGSPVFDDLWRVVAVHHAGGDLTKNARGERIYANEGILAQYIARELRL